MRTLSQITRVLAAASALALPAVTAAQSTNKPIVAVLSFYNTSIGANKADYDGLGKGIQELLIADLANNANLRLVDRERIQAVVEEQNLTKSGAIDATTAVRLGKILGAHYVIYGAFLNSPSGVVLTAHTTDMETSQIQNPLKVTGSANDVLGLIGQMSTRVNGLKLEAKPGRRVGDAGSDAAPAAAPASSGAVQSGGTKPGESKPADSKPAAKVETFAKPLSASSKAAKMDLATTNLFAAALDQLDSKHPDKAAVLFQKVLDKAPNFEPAREQLKRLTKSGN